MPRIPSLAFAAGLFAALTMAPAAELRLKVTDSKGRPVEDAVVSLVRADGVTPPAQALAGIEVMQKDQLFTPYVTIVTVGTEVRLPNRDTVQHHVYSLSKPKRFELPLYEPGKAESVVFDQPGVVTLGCNIHDWMSAYIIVVATPWFAKTDTEGLAVLKAPAGQYRFELWHPRLAGSLMRPVTLADGEAGEPVVFPLNLKPDRRVRRAPDGKSAGY